MSTVRARLAIALAALVTAAALSACGGGGDTASSSDAAATTSTATAPAGSTTTEDSSTSASDEESGSPESRVAPDAEVTAGLTELKGVAAAIAASPDGNAAKDAAGKVIEPVWQPIEGTVKKNEPDLYLDVEDSFGLLGSGDLDQAKRGQKRLATAVDAYLAKHPG